MDALTMKRSGLVSQLNRLRKLLADAKDPIGLNESKKRIEKLYNIMQQLETIQTEIEV